MEQNSKQSQEQPEQQELDALSSRVMTYANGALLMPAIVIGDKLGLFDGLLKGPITSTDLAGQLNLRERWVREWLYALSTARLITYAGDNKYDISSFQTLSFPHFSSQILSFICTKTVLDE